MKTFHKMKGFTLIELLIVIALIAVLAGAIIIALNPARQFALARNSERWSHVQAILGLVSQNIVENRGTWTCAGTTLPATATNMSSTAGDYDICACLIPTYSTSLPFDPSNGSYTDCTAYDTQYSIVQSATSSRITVAATGELGALISVTQ